MGLENGNALVFVVVRQLAQNLDELARRLNELEKAVVKLTSEKPTQEEFLHDLSEAIEQLNSD
jgi:predicted  nucleic acid-binding Zn-ribbon protein